MKPSFYCTVLTVSVCLSGFCGNTFFVSTSGNDSTGTGTISNTWRTINRGIAAMSGGDVLIIRGGVYGEQINNSVPSGTNWASPTVVQAYAGETVCLNPVTSSNSPDIIRMVGSAKHYVVFDGLTLEGTNLAVGGSCVKITYSVSGDAAQYIRFTNCVMRNAYDGMGVLLTASVDYTPTYCQFLNCVIYGNGMPSMDENPNKHGFYMSTSGNLIDGCTIFSNLDIGVHLYNGRPSGNIVRNCTFSTSPGKTGIGLYGGTNNQFYNNVFYGYNVGVLINPSDFTTNTLIANNSFYSNSVSILLLNNAAYAGSAVIANNLIGSQTLGTYGAVHLGSSVSSASPIVVSNNVLAGNGLAGQLYDAAQQAISGKNLTNQPSAGFLDPVHSDFRLLPQSVARKAGIPLNAFSVDARGLVRSNWDGGAFLFPPLNPTGPVHIP